MNLYKISQDTNNDYDTYDSAIVCAETEDKARAIHPAGEDEEWNDYTWVEKDRVKFDVKVELIGIAAEHIKGNTIICSSFNAG